MSLEQAIAENTAAVRELVGVWAKLVAQGKNINAQVASGEATAVTAGDMTIPVVKVEAPKSSKAVATPAATVTATPAPAATAPAEPVAESPSEVVDYAEVSKAISAAAVAKGKAEVVAVLTAFGAKRGPDLKPEQYADFLKALAA